LFDIMSDLVFEDISLLNSMPSMRHTHTMKNLLKYTYSSVRFRGCERVCKVLIDKLLTD
jgi:hypothetical protein